MPVRLSVLNRFSVRRRRLQRKRRGDRTLEDLAREGLHLEHRSEGQRSQRSEACAVALFLAFVLEVTSYMTLKNVGRDAVVVPDELVI